MKRRDKILFVLLILVILSVYNLYLQFYNKTRVVRLNDLSNGKNILEQIISFQNTTTDKIAKTNDNQKSTNCNPFNLNAKQYQVIIDGATYPKIIPLRDNKTINFDCLNKAEKPKVILLWTPFYDRDDFYFGLGKYEPFKKHKCPVYNCEITKDRNRLSESDIVVASFVNKVDSVPKKHKENQQWVFVIIESPVHVTGFSGQNGLFNLAVTYRKDADFMSHYAYESQLVWEDNPNFKSNFDYYEGKTDFAAIVVSNCGGSSGRLQYVNEMKKYVPVNIYGACGQPCPKAFDNGTEADCKVIIGQKYKFFLAFENSLCRDYITEKFFIILRYNIIPVVLGAGIYEDYVPKSGYINVLDFGSPKELSEYLLYLDKNRTAYNSYFQWKKHTVKKYDGIFAAEICEFCIRAHVDAYNGIQKKVINDLDQYWNPGADCKSVAHYPQLKV